MAEKGLTREFLAERDLRIFKMRQAGVPIAEIARRFGIGTSNVSNSVKRQLNKLSQEALLIYPEVLQMELERLDALQSAIWPLTQHRKQKMDDGTEVSIEPDIKAVSTVLSIIDRRAKLLGMEQTNVNVQMDVRDSSPIRAVLAGNFQVARVGPGSLGKVAASGGRGANCLRRGRQEALGWAFQLRAYGVKTRYGPPPPVKISGASWSTASFSS